MLLSFQCLYPNLKVELRLLPMMDFETTVVEVASRLRSDSPALVLLDVREPWEIAKASIAGSRNIPMGELPSRALRELDPEEEIVVVCHSGVRSLKTTVWLRNQGFEKVQSLRGGIDAWSREIDPQVPRY